MLYTPHVLLTPEFFGVFAIPLYRNSMLYHSHLLRTRSSASSEKMHNLVQLTSRIHNDPKIQLSFESHIFTRDSSEMTLGCIKGPVPAMWRIEGLFAGVKYVKVRR